jgi:hypothetical protein
VWPYPFEQASLIYHSPSQEMAEILLKKEVSEMLAQLIKAVAVAN